VIAPELSHELTLSPGDLGNMSAIWFWAFALSQLFVGWSLDRIGPRSTMAGMMLSAVAGALLLAGAQGIAGCLAGMALIGIGCSPIYMGSLFLFGRSGDTKRFALMSSLLLGIGSLGNAISSKPLAAASQAFGWRPTFVGIAVATTVSALLVAAVVRDPERIETASGSGQGLLAGLLKILSLRSLWPFFPLTLVSYAVLLAERGLWVGPYLAEVHGLSPIPRGDAVLAMALAMSAGALLYGSTDRLGLGRKQVVAWGSLATGGLFLLLAAGGGGSLAATVVILALIGAAGMTYVQLMAHAKVFIPEALLGRGISTMNMLFFAGAGLLQQLSGAAVAAMKSAGWPPVSTYCALHAAFGALLLAGTAIYLTSRRTPQ